MNNKHFNIRVSGKVQAVDFRYNAQQTAEELGLCGYVKNEYDGSVYLEVEGDEKKLAKFVDWCRHGSAYSKVLELEISEDDFKSFSDFRIEY
jgi:acylphosphatase